MSDTLLEANRRLDKWLWCARLFKTRSLAARFITDTGVRLTRGGVTERVEKPAKMLSPGDQVSFMLGQRLVVLTVEAFAERRGPPAAARTLYRQIEPAAVQAACAARR